MKSIGKIGWLAIPVLIVPLLFPWSAIAQSNNIYSWTDENGVKHFSDRAPANVEATEESIPKTQTAAAGGAADPADTLNNQPISNSAENPAAGEVSAGEELSYAEQQRKEIAERRQAEKQQQSEREQLCLNARDELARIEPGRRVLYTDEDGKTTRLDDEERVRIIEDSKKQIAEFCN